MSSPEKLAGEAPLSIFRDSSLNRRVEGGGAEALPDGAIWYRVCM
jgi:hypothetical protein